MKNPILRVLFAILLSFLAIILMPTIMISSIKGGESYLKEYPFLPHLMMLATSILIILILNKGNLKGYGFTWNWNFSVLKVILISLSLGGVSAIISFLFKISEANTPWENWSFLEGVLYAWIIASIAEEVLTRGLLQGFLTPLKHLGIQLFKYHISLPVIVSAVFFSLIHLVILVSGTDITMVIIVLILALLLGLIAGYLREKTGSLVPAIVVHSCFNIGSSLFALIVTLG